MTGCVIPLWFDGLTTAVLHCEAALGRHNVIARPLWAEAIFDSTRDSPVVRGLTTAVLHCEAALGRSNL